jgi:protein-S-isoprenylcysteine O-methyltransferase Ste14
VNRLLAVRLIVSILPLVFAYALVAIRRNSKSLVAALVLGLLWNAWALLAVNIVAIRLGWWSFNPDVPSFTGVAIEPWFGWTILWAFVPLIATNRPAALTFVGVAWLDLIAMPALEPVVILREGWLLGEGLALMVAFLPGLLFFRWTLTRTHLVGRLSLQIMCSSALLLWLVPSVALGSSGGWGSVFNLPTWHLGLVAQVVALPALLGVRAAIEFAEKGRGTPLPYDPPTQLVTSGPYSYVRNPMQLSMVLVFVVAGIALWNEWLIGAAVVAFIYGVGLAEWHEDVQLSERYGDRWTLYRKSIRSWMPRVRPLIADESTLLVAYSCGTCSSIGRWFLSRNPVGLRIAPAETSGDPVLRRVTYLSAAGPPKRGVAAIARALEHIHLGWAIVGWILAMPVISQFAQLVADVFGPMSQQVAGLPYDGSACAVDRSSTDGVGRVPVSTAR